MSARDRILAKLRQAQKNHHTLTPSPIRREAETNTGSHKGDTLSRPVGTGGWGQERRSMIPLPPMNDAERLALFIGEAEQLGCSIYQLNANEAIEQIMDLLDGDRRVLSWAEEHLPVADLHSMLDSLGVAVAEPDDGSVRVGISGASAALAATGSLVLESGPGRPRSASLLPDVHISLMTPDQILTDLEDWQAAQKANGYPALREASNTVIVTGPSKTADIGHQLVKGAHGPRELHIFILR